MLLKFFTANSLLALVFAIGLGAAPAAYAQDSGPTGMPQQVPQNMPEAMDPADVTNEHLEKFANVNIKAQEIQEKYRGEVDGVKNMEDLQKVQQKMNGELIDAIQAEDMSVEEYQQVGAAVQKDPELSKKVVAKITHKIQLQGK